ncbi:MAG: sensor histidine kinase [Inquilinaceae bacterium]
MNLPTIQRSLSARLLVLTVFFVMVAEVLIYTPSIARARLIWLEDKLAAAHLAALAIVATPQGAVTEELERELLDHVNAYMIDLRRPNFSTYMLGSTMPPIDLQVDLRERDAVGLIVGAFNTLFAEEGRVIRVSGWSPRDANAYVEVVLDEEPLRQEMIDFSGRILWLSIVISLITAGLVFLSLRWLMVLPMQRFTEKMVAFREDPEDAANVVMPSRRTDEIGIAQRELHDMQDAVRTALKQKARLAALGTAVTKITHDLRNILSTAALLSERLIDSGDPDVKRIAPNLVRSIDRAVQLCIQTLDYTGEGGAALHRSRVDLSDLVDEVTQDLTALESDRQRWVNRVPPGLSVQADRDQLLRVFANLGRNAFEAGAETVTIQARPEQDCVEVTVTDDGPGLPPRARKHLFQPFAGKGRAGGTGLGLAIAREIMIAHRGDLKLADSAATGTEFVLTLPVSAAAPSLRDADG